MFVFYLGMPHVHVLVTWTMNATSFVSAVALSEGVFTEDEHKDTRDWEAGWHSGPRSKGEQEFPMGAICVHMHLVDTLCVLKMFNEVSMNTWGWWVKPVGSWLSWIHLLKCCVGTTILEAWKWWQTSVATYWRYFQQVCHVMTNLSARSIEGLGVGGGLEAC